MARRLIRPSRLRIAPLVPVLATLAVVGPLLWYWMSGLIQRAAGDHLSTALPVMVRLVVPHLSAEPGEVQRSVLGLIGDAPLRLTVIREDGVVVADSARTEEAVRAMDNHAGRPEIRDALEKGLGVATRFSSTLGRDFVYAAQPVVAPDGRRFVIRLAEPVRELADLRRRLAVLLLLAGAISLITVALVYLWLERGLFRPLTAMIEAAGRLARGELEQSIPVPPEAEMASLATSLNRLAARTRREVEAVEAERRHLLSVVDSLAEGILVTDRRGHGALANRSFRRLFGLSPDDVEGRSVLELTRQPALEAAIDRVQATGESLTLDLDLPIEEGRTVVFGCSRLTDGSGVVSAARDVTEERRLTQVRRDLVVNVSHELKTPLTAIRGSAETLREGALEDAGAARGFTRRILEQCDRLQALLEDLLTLARLERPEAPAEPAAVDLREVVKAALETVATEAAERQVSLSSDLQPVEGLLGDRRALAALCTNLLDNAVKYNRAGGSVRVRTAVEGSAALLEVEDDGAGIPARDLPRVFERFYRVDRSRSRGEGGTGLGLAIVKHAAELHGGRVEVESRVGRGSLFRVVLPLARGPAKETD